MGGIILIPIAAEEKGVPNGIATLDGTGKVPVSQIPSSVADAMTYKGPWDASGGTLPGGTPANGDTYRISVAGTLSIGEAEVGDLLVYDGSVPQWDLFQANLTVGDLVGEVPQIGVNLVASEILETDASKKLKTATKGTAYNKTFGPAAGNVPDIATGGITASQVIVSEAAAKLSSEAKGSAFNKAFGTGAGDVCQGNDARFIFGSELNDGESLGETTYTGTVNYQGKLTVNLTSIPAGDYLITWGCNLGSDSTGDEMDAGIELDNGGTPGAGTLLDLAQMVAFKLYTTAHYPKQGASVKRTLAAGTHRIDLIFKTTNVGKTVAIKNARLQIWRIA